MPGNKIRTAKVRDCIAWMKELHEGQVRKLSKTPYYTHPLGVLGLMEQCPFFFTDDDKCSALLHDIKEDSPLFSWEELVRRYGKNVAGAVASLSKTKLGETNPEVYFSMLSLSHPRVIAIKLMDRLQNTSDFDIAVDPEWLEKYVEETVELVWPLIQVLPSRGRSVAGGFYELGVWIEERLQSNVQGMTARAEELRRHQREAR